MLTDRPEVARMFYKNVRVVLKETPIKLIYLTTNKNVVVVVHICTTKEELEVRAPEMF